MGTSIQFAPRARTVLIVAFSAVALACATMTAFAVMRTQRTGQETDYIASNAMASIRLVDRINLDIVRARVLINRHILTGDRAEIVPIEAELDQRLADIQQASLSYEPLVSLPHEGQTWALVKTELQELHRVVDQVLALSRANHDAEARALLLSVRPQLDAVSAHLETLAAINDGAGLDALARVRRSHSQLCVAFVGFGVTALAGLYLLARWSLRQVQLRDEQASRDAARLTERNRDLDAFAGRVAHDLRGPLGSVSLAVSRLGETSPAEAATIDVLRRGVRRMETLIDDLLALSTAQAQQGCCDPAVATATLRDEYADRVHARKGTLRVAVEHAKVRCNDGLFKQALANLLDNSVKFSRADAAPEIELSGAAKDGVYELRVADNGVGVSPDDARRVFEPFYRTQRAREVPGTGLGLSIVKRVVEVCGGEVAVESREGHGTIFVIHLPLAEDTTARGGETSYWT